MKLIERITEMNFKYFLEGLEVPISNIVASMATSGNYSAEELAAAYETLLKKAVALRIDVIYELGWFKELDPQ